MASNEGDKSEAEARTALQAMLPRLGDAPHALLGVPPTATPDVLRTAFLRLTKQFHPTKYARFSPDVVRLANEVFLTIKRAYDTLSPGPRTVAGGSGLRAVVRASGTSPPPTKPARPATPARGVPRAPTPSTGVPIAVPRVPTAPLRAAPPTSTPPRRAPTGSPPPPMSPSEAEFEAAVDLLRRKLWVEARQAFHKLAVATPNDKRYRAHMHYARGRESQDAGRLDEARAELQRALALDPDFIRAKSALSDLTPQPPPSGGLLGRLFKK